MKIITPSLPSSIVLLAYFSLGCTPEECPPCPECPECPECPQARPAPGEPAQQPSKWFVVHVIDGDTLIAKLEKPERKETIRLLYINTPERNRPGFGEATEALKGLVRGGYISLEFDKPGVEKRDVYGRLLAYVIADGVNCNVEMVRLGWSPFWKKYGKGYLADDLQSAEEEAKRNKRGLWGMDAE